MKALMRSRMSLFTACTAAFAGGVALLISNGERMSEGAGLASANAAPTNAALVSGWNDLDFLLCHTPTKAASAMTAINTLAPVGCVVPRGIENIVAEIEPTCPAKTGIPGYDRVWPPQGHNNLRAVSRVTASVPWFP